MLFRPLNILEANAYLPFVKDKLNLIQTLVFKAKLLQQHLENNKITRVVRLQNDGQYHSEVYDYATIRSQVLAIEEEIRQEIVHLQSLGIIIRSIAPGRVCFIAEKHRQPVYLSWEIGEETVDYWHGLDDGFSARQKVHNPDAFGVGYIH